MEKTKLGISVGLMGAILYCFGLFGGYFIAVAAVAYVLICEENEWLKKTAVKVLALTFLFPILHTVIGVIPDLIGLVADVLNIFNKYVDFRIVDSIMTLIRDIVNITEYVIFILLGVLALSQKTVTIPLLDPFIDKHMN